MTRICYISTWAACLCVFGLSSPAWGQQAESEDGVWELVTPENTAELAQARDEIRFRPRVFQLFRFNPEAFQQIAGRTPRALSAVRALDSDNGPNGPEFSLPMPNGEFMRFRLEETDVMALELAARFPEIRTFRGVAEDGKTVVHADIGPQGFHAQVLGVDGVTIVDPWDAEGNHASYLKSDARFDRSQFTCEVTTPENAAARDAARPAATSGGLLRTYRLAVGCTRHYAAKHGGTKASALSAIVTTINRVNQVYQRDLCVRLQLVSNNDKIIFTDAMDDPYTGNNNARVLINESQSVIDNRIGAANYDIGHTFSTGAGGLAGLGVVCVPGQKARGVTGNSNPVGDPFDIDYVAHEMGHQFSGNHTFNGKIGSCAGGNRNASTAVEPGSGSTIQAYAGICGSDDLQPNSDPYFHAVSLDEMLTFINSGAASIVSGIPTGNSAPTVSAGNNCAIPKQTPFQLTASGNDPNGDVVSYCWEQMDIGPPTNLGESDNGSNPLFRSFDPVVNPTRVIPQMATLLGGSTGNAEILPTQNRALTFRVTARDNRMTGGGINGADVVLTVNSAAGPFRVTSPSGGSHAGVVEVKWDVAQTDLDPIQTRFVNILLSQDGGQSFSTTLATNTPNDGQQLVSLPPVNASIARIKVEAVGNVFFNISDPFSLSQARSVAILVRHAEKAGSSSDPELTPAGMQRALALSQEISNCDVREVRATNTRRAMQTAAPAAQSVGVNVDEYSDVSSICDTLSNMSDGRIVLVVGHSDTVPQMVQRLQPGTNITINEDQFDQMFVMIRGIDNQSTMIHRSYSGEPIQTNAPAQWVEGGNVATAPAGRSANEDILQSDLNALRLEVRELREELQKMKVGIEAR